MNFKKKRNLNDFLLTKDDKNQDIHVLIHSIILNIYFNSSIFLLEGLIVLKVTLQLRRSIILVSFYWVTLTFDFSFSLISWFITTRDNT